MNAEQRHLIHLTIDGLIERLCHKEAEDYMNSLEKRNLPYPKQDEVDFIAGNIKLTVVSKLIQSN